MGNKKTKAIDLHHQQVDKSKEKKRLRYQAKLAFEIKRIGIKAKVEADREALIVGLLIFMIGLGLIFFGLIYITGVVLYG